MDQALSTSLEGLAKRIRREQGAVEAALTGVAAHAMAAGDLLLEAKKQVPHGDWLTWLAVHCELGETTAQSYMRLAKNRTKIEANPQRVADLSLRKALKLIAPVPAKGAAIVEFIPPDRTSGELSQQELIAKGRQLLGLDDIDIEQGDSDDALPDAHPHPPQAREEEGARLGARSLFSRIAAALPSFPRKTEAPPSPERARLFFVQAIDECRKLDIGLDELIAIKSYGTVEDLVAVYESLEVPEAQRKSEAG